MFYWGINFWKIFFSSISFIIQLSIYGFSFALLPPTSGNETKRENKKKKKQKERKKSEVGARKLKLIVLFNKRTQQFENKDSIRRIMIKGDKLGTYLN